jgi:outer membrane protein assembly factor BamE
MRVLFRTLAVCMVLGGCSWLPPSLGVYKLDINQGNYITQDQVERLRVGQTRQQVRLIMGTPLLVDPFHAARWDYVYEFERQGRVLEHSQLTVYFVNEKVARWEGTELPPAPTQVAEGGGASDARLDKSLALAPKTAETNWLQDLLKKLGWWGQ